ncbi:MAG: hypothetical protein K2X03_03730 [Bryobacteraceae bacterium]|nr:hypothetical protein [Bryobacteraceae bacterium]
MSAQYLDSVNKAIDDRNAYLRSQPETRARIDLMRAEQKKLEAEAAKIRADQERSLSADRIACTLGIDVRVPNDEEVQLAMQRMADKYPDIEKYSKTMSTLAKSFLSGKQGSHFEYLQGLYILAKYTELSSVPAAERGSLREPVSK